LNQSTRQLRIAGFVPIDAHDPKKPNIFLEVLVCARNTKEHEALVVTDAKPSHVHAALLLLGIEPGSPGRWDWLANTAKPSPNPPTGPRLRISVQPANATSPAPAYEPRDITSWVIQVDRTTRLRPSDHFVFAGSRFQTIGPANQTRDAYAADVDGTIIGLAAFGSETIAWTGMYHPDISVQSPAWIADSGALPAFGTNVDVYVTIEADK